MSKLITAVVQQAMTPDKATNLAESKKLIADAARSGAQLILLPELHATRYFCQWETPDNFSLAENLEGPTAQQLSQWAAEYKIILIGSIFEKRAPGIFHNTALVFNAQGERVGFYRKMHIPHDPGFYEKYYFTPGENPLGFSPISANSINCGVLICWDQWFPEAARIMALKGAQLLLYPTAIGWDPNDTIEEQQRQKEAWITIQRSHAIANHLPVLTANRCGFEEDPTAILAGTQFWGNSFIAGPQGEILQQANASDSKTLLAEIDFARTEQLRQIWPYFRDRRIDAYGELLERYSNS